MVNIYSKINHHPLFIFQDIDVPDDIVLDTIIEDICFHPEKNVIAYGDIDGVVGM